MRDQATEKDWINICELVFYGNRDTRDIFDLGWHSRDKEIEKLKELIVKLEQELKPYITGR